MIGFEADWNKIFNLEGPGTYYFTSDFVVIGQPFSKRTWFYALEEYSDIAADNTQVIESFKSGQITGGIDYRGFDWRSTIRLRGTFGEFTPELQKDHFETTGRLDQQNRDSLSFTYALATELVTYEVITPFIKDSLLSNNMFIRTYELQGFLPTLKRINVVPEEIEKPDYFERNTNGVFVFIFSDKLKEPVKNNF